MSSHAGYRHIAEQTTGKGKGQTKDRQNSGQNSGVRGVVCALCTHLKRNTWLAPRVSKDGREAAEIKWETRHTRNRHSKESKRSRAVAGRGGAAGPKEIDRARRGRGH